MDRIEWQSLPSDLCNAVQDELGPIIKVEPISEGRRSALATVAHLKGGPVFLKGAPLANERAAAQLDREAAVNPHVLPATPKLLCNLTASGWRLLGFEYVQGRRADYTPGSRDVNAVLEVLATLENRQLPANVDVMWFEGRWSDYATVPQHLTQIAGTALLHTDLNPGNVMITGTGARLVDWGMASRGASLVNPADLVVNLIACGHAPTEAEAIVADLDTWKNADPAVLDYYARLLATTWLEAFWTPTHPWA
ncbi:phosphotransferase, partial [Actinomadura sp. 7K534]|uniref:phosphotransferase n=1 Tax=Actinomadura sp. 7K534 TaxID=2530366 RepID=UPI0010510042